MLRHGVERFTKGYFKLDKVVLCLHGTFETNHVFQHFGSHFISHFQLAKKASRGHFFCPDIFIQHRIRDLEPKQAVSKKLLSPLFPPPELYVPLASGYKLETSLAYWDHGIPDRHQIDRHQTMEYQTDSRHKTPANPLHLHACVGTFLIPTICETGIVCPVATTPLLLCQNWRALYATFMS